MEQENGNNFDRDMLYLMGGAALMLLGAGLVLSNSKVRSTVTSAVSSILPELQGRFAPDLTAVGSDIQRYLKLKSM